MTGGAESLVLERALPSRRPLQRWTTPGWQVAGVGVAAVSWASAAAAVVLLVVNGSTPELAYWLMDVLVAVVYGGACLLMLPRSRHPVVWILVLSAVGCGISGLLTTYLGLTGEHPGVWAPAQLWILSTWVWVPGTYASMAVLPWLVSYRRVPLWARLVVALAVTAIAWRVLANLTGRYVGLDNPLAGVPAGIHELSETLGVWPDRLCVVICFAGVLRLLWLRLRAVDDEGRGYGWLCIGQLFLAVAFVPVVFPMPDAVDRIATDFAGASLIAAQPFLPGALLVVVLGHRLWGIDVAVDRASVWLLLSAMLVTCYLVFGWFTQRVLSASEGSAALVGFGVLLVVSQPLRSWVQSRVDRLVYGRATDPGLLLDEVGSAAGAASDPSHRSLEALVGALASGLRLGRVEVWADDGALLAATGIPMATDHAVDLVTHGRVGGSLAVAAAPGQALDTRSRRQVDQLAPLIAVFVELAEVNERLDAARRRLVEVRHEERRMLRRDLHDGMGPALAGVGLGLAAVERRVAQDPDGAVALLRELKDEIDRRTEDMRLLARSMLPAALDDGDIAGALEVLAARFSAAGVAVTVDTSGLREVDTRRQIAIYHVAAEAVVNAYRHGRAKRVQVIVRAGGGRDEVVLDVVDDGRGLGPAPGRGVGMQSMRERAEELSGRLEVSDAADEAGTRVRMVLP